MRILGVLFYATILILIGLALISFSTLLTIKSDILQPEDISSMYSYIQNSIAARIIIFLSGALLILVSFSFAQLILGRFQREKTIAFTTASGQVTIALPAVEDLIRRIAEFMPEIKELRPDVIATKKGIIIDIRAILKSEANIQELTSRLQELTKSKIQEVLGLEEQIVINIHVAKIISAEEKRKKETDKEEPTIPFRGFGRV